MGNAFESPSLNLTPKRGPSVWMDADRSHTLGPQRLALIVGGAVLVAAGLQRRGAGRAGAATLGIACIAAGWFCEGWIADASTWLTRVGRGSGPRLVDTIDQASEDSFPASDPPSSMQIAVSAAVWPTAGS